MIYCRRPDLLGSALLNFAHAWGFAEKLAKPLTVNWLHPALKWSEIFAPDQRFNLITDREIDLSAIHAVRRIPHTSAALATYPDLFYPHTSHVEVDQEPKMMWDTRVRKLLASLAIHPAILEAAAAINTDGRTAVHIRRGQDILDLFATDPLRASSQFVKRYADFESYRRCIEATTYGPLLIFSNSSPDAHALARLLPHHNSVIVGDCPSLAKLTRTQRDFAEMLLMSRCRQIICCRSNYARFPALMGGIRGVLVHGWLSAPHLREFVERTVPAPHARRVMDHYAAILSRLAA